MHRDDKIAMLQHFVKRPSDLARFGDIVEQSGEMEDGDATIAAIWSAVHRYWREYGAGVPHVILTQCLGEVPALRPQRDRIGGICASWYGDLNKGLPERHLVEMVEELRAETVARSLKSAVDSGADVKDAVSGAYRQLSASLDESRIRGSNMFDDAEYVLAPGYNRPPEPPRRPSYVDFLDFGHAGGMRDGEVAGFVIPSGGGKTTLALQLANECVKRREYVAICAFEQKMLYDIKVRAYVLASDSTRAVWEDPRRVPVDVRERCDSAQPVWRRHFRYFDHFCDLDFELRDISQVFEPVERWIENERREWKDAPDRESRPEPRLHSLVLDWWGVVRTALLKAHAGRSDQARRDLILDAKKAMPAWADRLGCRLYVMQQTKGASRTSKHVGSSDAQEDSNFDNFFQYCWGLTSKEENGERLKASLTKARGAATRTVSVRLDGERCRFHLYKSDRDRGEKVGSAAGGVSWTGDGGELDAKYVDGVDAMLQ